MKKSISKISFVFTSMILIVLLSGVLNNAVSASETIPSSSAIALPIETYIAGENQCTHPSVITFDKKWNGYQYWMAYTPYPYGNGEEENPSIAVSNDMKNWVTPKGIANPIADNEEVSCSELKDTHLLYNEKNKSLEVWYLGRLGENLGGDGESLLLFRKISKDGINWSNYEVMCNFNGVSPSVLWNGNEYILYSILRDESHPNGCLIYETSKDGKFSGNKKYIDTDFMDLWHGSVQFINGKYQFVYVGKEDYDRYIMYSESKDGISFSSPTKLIVNDSWNRFYRPCLAIENDTYYLYYGVISEDDRWMISCSYGKDLNNLQQITIADVKNPKEINIYPINNKIRLELFVNSIFECFSEKTFVLGFALMVFVCIFMVIFKKILNRKNKLKRIFIILTVLALFIANMTSIIMFSYSILAIIKCIITNCVLTVMESSVIILLMNFGKPKKNN